MGLQNATQLLAEQFAGDYFFLICFHNKIWSLNILWTATLGGKIKIWQDLASNTFFLSQQTKAHEESSGKT